MPFALDLLLLSAVPQVVPEVLEENTGPKDETFAAIMERFQYVEPSSREDYEEDEDGKPKRRTRPKASLLEENEVGTRERQPGALSCEDSDAENDPNKISKKKRKAYSI